MSEKEDVVIDIHLDREKIVALAVAAVDIHVKYDIDFDGNFTILDPTGRAVTMVYAAATKQKLCITRDIAAAYVTAEIQRRITRHLDNVRPVCDRMHLRTVKGGK